MERQRIITWEDPMTGASAARKLSGMDYLQKILEGQLPPPPIDNTLGIHPHDLAEGRVIFTFRLAEFHYDNRCVT